MTAAEIWNVVFGLLRVLAATTVAAWLSSLGTTKEGEYDEF